MKPKNKVLFYNFLTFAILFLIFRFGLSAILDISSIFISIIAAIIASVLAPKFAVIKKGTIVMKWIFLKGFKEL